MNALAYFKNTFDIHICLYCMFKPVDDFAWFIWTDSTTSLKWGIKNRNCLAPKVWGSCLHHISQKNKWQILWLRQPNFVLMLTMLNVNLCAHTCIYIYVCTDACECSEPSKIMANLVLVLYLSLVDDMVKDGVSFVYHFCFFRFLCTY
jgi:hypothetical protein